MLEVDEKLTRWEVPSRGMEEKCMGEVKGKKKKGKKRMKEIQEKWLVQGITQKNRLKGEKLNSCGLSMLQ